MYRNNQAGIILLLTTFVILFMAVLVIGYLDVATTETEIMQNHKLSTRALYISEAGIGDAIYTLRQQGNHNWDTGFTDKTFPVGSGSSYTVMIDNSGYPSIIITSTGTVSGVYQRTIEVGINLSGPPNSAPFPVSVIYWKEI